MEPILPMPNNLENTGVMPEINTQSGLVSAENSPNTSMEQPHEGMPVGATPAQAASPQPVPSQAATQVVQSSAQTAQTVAPDPQIADDVDVIEKEWVDKAKHIVGSTKEDPHEQGKEVSKLQADYLMKRYNKKIKLSE